MLMNDAEPMINLPGVGTVPVSALNAATGTPQALTGSAPTPLPQSATQSPAAPVAVQPSPLDAFVPMAVSAVQSTAPGEQGLDPNSGAPLNSSGQTPPPSPPPAPAPAEPALVTWIKNNPALALGIAAATWFAFFKK